MKICLISIGLATCLISCSSNSKNKSGNNNVDIQNNRIVRIQEKIDLASELYLKAIDEVNQGKNLKEVNANYLKTIGKLKKGVSQTFDSITSDYISHKISQAKYDSLRNEVFFDSVRVRSERLSTLGLNI